MIFFGGRLHLNTIPSILIFIVALYELCIVLRVLLSWLRLIAKMEEGPVSLVLYKMTEPVLFPVRRVVQPIIDAISVDITPAVVIALCELLQWLIRLIFRIR